MNRRRAIAATAAAFLVAQVLAVVIHGFLLAADYAPFRGTLLRGGSADTPPWQMVFLPVVHLLVIGSQVWLYGRLRLAGSTAARGLALGTIGWTMSQAPTWLLWYAQQPWPGTLVVKQLALELVSSLLIGLTIAIVAGRGRTSP